MKDLLANLHARFWPRTRIEPGGCWVWQGRRYRNGYGRAKFLNRTEMTHRLAWRLANGTIPGGLFVLHRCDNPPCVNPAHLFLGTAKDNAQDASRKGRTRSGPKLHPECTQRGDAHWSRRRPDLVARGERSGHAKLTDALVAEIRSSAERGVDIARRLGVSQATICDVRKGHIWRGCRAPGPFDVERFVALDDAS